MDTDGHSECAQVGVAILQAALQASGRKGWRTNAFYLGNWLTDVSQGVDPVAYDALQHDLPPLVVGLANTLNGYGLGIDVGAVSTRIAAAVAVLDGGRDSRAAKAIKRAFKWIGYHKFVHAESGVASGMDFAAFEHVIEVQYTQYYPHEHLDRWPAAPGPPGDDPTQVYTYLANDVKIAAGLIAQIDLEWASKAFVRDLGRSPWKDDKDPDWNLWVARLGHALHAVEDFFSHSNFIEHAIDALGSDDPRKSLRPEQPFLSFGLTDADIYERRQTRYSEPQNDITETHVVTGYFDTVDSLFSLEHVVDELFPEKKAPEVTTTSTRAGRVLRDVLEQVQKRTEGRKNITEAEAREIAEKVVAEKLGTKDVEYDAFMGENVPAGIRGTFYDAVAGFSARTGGATMSLFEVFLLLKLLADAMSYPRRFIRWLLGDTIADIVSAVTDPVLTVAEPVLRMVFDNVLGRFRVGCHSLLAKDYRWKDRPNIDAIYEEAKKCSKEVHNYVVKVLTRWGKGSVAAVKRTDPLTDSASFNRLRRWMWVDWLDLMRYLLRHPKKTEEMVSDTWWYAVLHGKDGYFTYHKITEADLRTQIEGAETLRKAGEAAYSPSPRPSVGNMGKRAGGAIGKGVAAGAKKAQLAVGGKR